MKLAFRQAEIKDFDVFYTTFFYKDIRDAAQRNQVEHEWHVYLKCPLNLTMIVEEIETASRRTMVGFAQTVFVTDAYARYIKSEIAPFVNVHATRPLPDGSWPLLNLDDVRKANSDVGLNALTTHWMWADRLSDEKQLRVREFMDQTYPLFYRGYRYKEILIEGYGEWNLQSLTRAGYRVLNDYAAYLRCHPPVLPDGAQPYLMGATREEAIQQEGTLVSRLFAYTPPRFALKPHEQELLFAALLGGTDEDFAERLGVTMEAVKKRWLAIYAQVESADPTLLPSRSEGGRGVEKRATLLMYLRSHLEELRPIAATSRRTQRN